MTEKRKISFREAIREALEEELERDPRLIVIGEDVSEINLASLERSDSLRKKFPGRIIDRLPLVEEMSCGIGLGMSVGGLKPIIQFNHGIFMALDAYEIYRLGTWRYHMSEKEGPGIVIRLGHNGFSGNGADFSASFLAHVFHMPNLRIAAPAYPYHAKGLLKSAIRANQPVVFVEHKFPSIYHRNGLVPDEEYLVPFGTSVMVKTGKDITLVAWMLMTHFASASAKLLEKEGIDAEVISPQTLNPLDMPSILVSAQKTGRVLIVEEEMERGGIGAEIAARIAARLPGCRVERLAAKNVPLPANAVCQEYVLPTVEGITAACSRLIRQTS